MATRRSTRNLSNEPSEPETNNKLLSAICLKLDTINDSLQLIIKNQQDGHNSNKTQYGSITSSIQDIQNNVAISVKKFAESESRATIFRRRKRIIDTWKRQLNKRKQLHWQSINCNNTAVIYETWLNNEKKTVPRKFLMKEIANEDPDEKAIRKEGVINDFQAEIQLLKVRADRHEANYTKVDEEMSKLLRTRFSGYELDELEKLWYEDITNEESKSQSKWQSKQEWLEQYEQNFDNEDLVKPRNDTRPTNSSNSRQHSARHNNNRQQITEKPRATSTTSHMNQRSINPQSTNNTRRPVNNQFKNTKTNTSH